MGATSLAECLEMEIGASVRDARVECFAVPLAPGSSRRKTRWTFLVATDVPERTVREALEGFQVELIERRGTRRVYTAWAHGTDHGGL